MNKLSFYISKSIRKALQIIFRFDKWHVSVLSERPYAGKIIQYCNQLPRREWIAEIGCGLGDILRNVDFKYRNGYDIDKNVLRAAAILPVRFPKKSITFKVFSFPSSHLEGKFDVLILVNWIHHITPEVLENKLLDYFTHNLTEEGIMIIDTVQDPAYKYNHNISFITQNFNCSLTSLGKYQRERELWAIKKSK